MAYLTHLSNTNCMTEKCSRQVSLEQKRKANYNDDFVKSGSDTCETSPNRVSQERTNEKRILVACLESLGKQLLEIKKYSWVCKTTTEGRFGGTLVKI